MTGHLDELPLVPYLVPLPPSTVGGKGEEDEVNGGGLFSVCVSFTLGAAGHFARWGGAGVRAGVVFYSPISFPFLGSLEGGGA